VAVEELYLLEGPGPPYGQQYQGASSAFSSLAWCLEHPSRRRRFPQLNLGGDASKLPHRDFALFSNQAAPQREEAIAKLLIVLGFLPWELEGILVFASRAHTGWLQGSDGSRQKLGMRNVTGTP